MGPMLLSRYAKDGTEKARRQMLAMCQSDPEILADVLGHFVAMVSENAKNVSQVGNDLAKSIPVSHSWLLCHWTGDG